MKQIIKLLDSIEFGLLCRNIYGLNIFEANSIFVETINDPRIIFLRSLSDQVSCSALTGYLSLKDIVDDPEEIFGKPEGEIPYHRVPVGLYAGRFYDITVWPTQDACFFSTINSDFWRAETQDKCSNIRDILKHDALSLLCDVRNDDEPGILRTLSLPFQDEDQWLKNVLEFYKLIIVSGGDAMDFHVYSKDEANFERINEPLSKAQNAIENSNWYLENADYLVWDDAEAMCLVSPV